MSRRQTFPSTSKLDAEQAAWLGRVDQATRAAAERMLAAGYSLTPGKAKKLSARLGLFVHKLYGHKSADEAARLAVRRMAEIVSELRKDLPPVNLKTHAVGGEV